MEDSHISWNLPYWSFQNELDQKSVKSPSSELVLPRFKRSDPPGELDSKLEMLTTSGRLGSFTSMVVEIYTA